MTTESFLNKYKGLNNWNKYNSSGCKMPNSSCYSSGNNCTGVACGGSGSSGYNTYSSSCSSGGPELANEILAQAGPSCVYQRPCYSSEAHNVTKVTTEITHQPGGQVQYTINNDPDPVRVTRPIDCASARQTVRIRYLEPPQPPAPAPIIIKERQLTPPPPAPPIVIRQRQPAPPTPPPLLIRERPPTAPKCLEPTIIEKVIPAPPPPPRQVIVERIPAPEKPRDIIYEKWLPYKDMGERPVIVERGKVYERQPAPKNVIIEYEKPSVCIEKQLIDEGIIRADPKTYDSSRCFGGEVRVVDKITEFPLPAGASRRPGSTSCVCPSKSGGTSYSYNCPTTTNVQVCPSTSTSALCTSSSNKCGNGQDRVKSCSVNSNASGGRPTGPSTYAGPWNTTYRTSYTGRGFNNYKPPK